MLEGRSMSHRLRRWSVGNPRPWGDHGPPRATVRGARPAAAEAPPADGSPRPALARSPRRAERDSLGAAHRGPVGRSPRALSAVPDLPSPLSTLGARRHPDTGAARPRGRSGRARQVGPERSLHRRHLRGGQKGGACVGKTKRGKGSKIMAVADRAGLPVAVSIASASPHEVTLVDATLDQRFTAAAPERLIGDKAYDSDTLDARLFAERGIELIAPHRTNRRRPPTQDGRPLRRYRRRWKMERLHAWLQNYRRVLVRWEYHLENFRGFVQLACALILMRHL